MQSSATIKTTQAVISRLYIVALILVLSAARSNAQTVSVSGTVTLGGQTNHSGVEIYFEPLSPSARAATVFSESDGFWSNAAVNIGIYNIRIRKNGFVPGIIPNVFLSKDSTFATVNLRAGGVAPLAGNISGRTLSGDTLYQVTANLIAISGTLTIEGGAELQFAAGTGLTVSGGAKLMVNGTKNRRVLLTSGTAVPNFGDWTGVTVNGGTGHRVLHTTFHYAKTALRIENFSDVTLDSIRIDRVALRQQNLNVLNGSNFKLLNSYITAKEKGNAWLHNVNGFEIDGNYFHNGRGALRITECRNGMIDGNQFQDYDAYAILDSDWENTGTGTWFDQNLRNITVQNNVFTCTVYRNELVIALGSYDAVVKNNRAYIGGGKKSSNRWQFVHLGHGTIEGNTLQYDNAAGGEPSLHTLFHTRGESWSQVTIRKNKINLYSDQHVYYPIFVRMWKGVFAENKINLNVNGYYYENSYFIGTDSVYKNQIFYTAEYNSGYYTDFESVKNVVDNEFYFLNRYNGHSLMQFTNCENVERNHVIIRGGKWDNEWNLAIRNHTRIKNNSFEIHGKILVESLSAQSEISYNTFLLGKFPYMSNDVSAFHIRANSAGLIRNNTVIADPKNGRTGYAVLVTGNSEPNIVNNHFEGFETGIILENEPGDIYFNNFANTGAMFAGNYTLPFAGNLATVNHLGSTSDIYYNTREDASFRKPYTFQYGNLNWADTAAHRSGNFNHLFLDTYNFNLLPTSKLIDAGSDRYTDPDNTRSDIGAFPYDDRGNPRNLRLLEEGNGTLRIGFKPVVRDSVQGYRVFAAIAPATPVEVDVLPANATEFTLTGLTNNVDYNVYMTTVFTNSESIPSAVGTYRPGVGRLETSSRTIRASKQNAGDIILEYSLTNSGTKSIEINIAFQPNDNRVYDKSGLNELGTINGSKFFALLIGWNRNQHWNNAQFRGLRLAQISSAEINEFLRTKLNAKWPNNGWWTGMYYSCGENSNGEYACGWGFSRKRPNGEEYFLVSDYLNFNPGEPSGNGNTVQFLDANGKWDDDSWWNGKYAIYELPPFMYVRNSRGTIRLNPGQTLSFLDSLVTVPGVTSGRYYLTDSKSGSLIDSISVVAISGVGEGLPPVYYPAVTASGASHLVVINSASVDGVNLVAGDELALYDGQKIVGATSFNGAFPILMNAYGYTAGNDLQLHYYLSGTGESTVATLMVSQGTPTYETGGYSIVSSTGTFRVPLTVHVRNNRFNLVSVNINLPDKRPQSVFTIGTQIVQDDEGSVWIPEYNINTIGDMRRERSYHVFQNSGVDQSYTLNGRVINLGEVPVGLFGNRFNNVPMLHQQAVPVTEVFAGLASRISIVQDDDGNAWIPSLNVNNIGSMQPGRGYQLFLTGRDTSFYYPEISGVTKEVAQPVIAATEFFKDVVNTGLPWNVVIERIDVPAGVKVNEIGLYDGGTLVGSAVVKDGRFVVTTFRKSTDPDLPGFTSGNVITAKGWIKEGNKTIDLVVAPVSGQGSIAFGEQAFAQVILVEPGLATSGGLEKPTAFALSQNYPNPFNPSTTIRFDVPQTEHVRIEVYNILGQKVAVLHDKITSAGTYRVTWDASRMASGIYMVRMQAGSFTTLRKAMLMK